MSAPTIRPELPLSRRIVVKLGTRILSGDEGGIARTRLQTILAEVAELRRNGKEVLIVTSGAVGIGAHAIGLTPPVTRISERQACAAVGQSQLMTLYRQELAQLGFIAGQVLLTHDDFEDRARYLNVRNTLLSLLRHGVIPVINENDAVSIAEIQDQAGQHPVFGDNDRLSALLASKLGADLLVLLTDVAGVYDRDPSKHSDATLISQAPPTEDSFDASEPTSGMGRGGMRSKVDAARIATRSGCHAVIASGFESRSLSQVCDGLELGTWFPALPGLSARRRWIAWGSPAKGSLTLDSGAVSALQNRGASLLAAGVTDVEGRFGRGDVVELLGQRGQVIGRGMVSCDADAAILWASGTAPDQAQNHHALVHRDHLVLEPQS